MMVFFLFFIFIADPHLTEARLARAEAYTALKHYRLALEDIEYCSTSSCSAEVGHPLTTEKKKSKIIIISSFFLASLFKIKSS